MISSQSGSALQAFLKNQLLQTGFTASVGRAKTSAKSQVFLQKAIRCDPG